MSRRGLCLKLSCFTDFDGHHTWLFDARCEVTCYTLWKSTKTEIPKYGYWDKTIGGWEGFMKLLHQQMSNRQEVSSTIWNKGNWKSCKTKTPAFQQLLLLIHVSGSLGTFSSESFLNNSYPSIYPFSHFRTHISESPCCCGCYIVLQVVLHLASNNLLWWSSK